MQDLWRAQFAIYPLELVRTRLAVCPMGTYTGISDCFRQIVRLEGYRAFYRGLSPSLVRPSVLPPSFCTLTILSSLICSLRHSRASAVFSTQTSSVESIEV